MPADTLFQYLKDIGDGQIAKETPDCSVVPYATDSGKNRTTITNLENTRLISTTDFFYPLIEDPYLQGRLACCNVLSDIYAMGISRVDHMLMILGISLAMREEHRQIVTREMIRGFDDCAKEAGTQITGGQSIMNPWPIIGGVANVMCQSNEYTKPNHGQPGDVLVLSKPLGTQPAVNLRQKLTSKEGKEGFFNGKAINEQEINDAYHMAIESMGHLSRNTARLMSKYKSRGATDVTGFGILGHAQNLATAQQQDVDLVLEALPILNKMDLHIEGMHDFAVAKGYSAETSGGILCMLEKEKAADFMKESLNDYGQETWVVG